MSSKTLPEGSKEAYAFRRMMRAYETKNYKAGLKLAKTILETKKDHGDTLAIQALIYSSMEKKDEAMDLAKKALRADFNSSLTWHVFGILHRQNSDYKQALKCFAQAQQKEKDNFNVTRDLSHLQIQLRDYEGFKETSYHAFELRSGQRNTWLAYAVSNHLCGDYDNAIDIMEQYIKVAEDTKDPEKGLNQYEFSEELMYVAQLCIESGKLDKAIDILTTREADLVDKRGRLEMLANIYTKQGELAEAKAIASTLLDMAPDTRKYYDLLMDAHGFNAETPVSERLALVDSILERHPRSRLAKTLPLTFTSGDLFKERVDAYLQASLRKGIPPLFKSLHTVFLDEEKHRVVKELVEGYAANLKASNSFAAGGDRESPAVFVWAMHFLAQVYDMEADYERAMTAITAAIDHTPTLVELYMIKAKILKHMGAIFEAAEVVDFARSLDTADRFINGKAVKYFLRCGMVDRALELAALFTRDSKILGPVDQLRDMQCSWFETEFANCCVDAEDYKGAVDKFCAVKSFFEVLVNDQFDFHGYCIRKVNLRAYVRFLKFEDVAYSQKPYVKAAILAAHLLVALHDNPPGSKEKRKEERLLAEMTESERKKYISKQRKAARKAEAEKEKSQKEEKHKPKVHKRILELTTWDMAAIFEGENGFLNEAMKFVQPLLELSHSNNEVYLAAFEVLLRKKKLLPLLKMINKLKSHPGPASVDGAYEYMCALFLPAYEAAKAELPAPIAEFIDEEMPAVFGDITSADAAVAQLKKHAKGSVRAAALFALLTTNFDSQKAPQVFAEALPPVEASTPFEAVKQYKFLKLRCDASDDDMAPAKTALHAFFPKCDQFSSRPATQATNTNEA